jgi:glycosyltransferase involved in cell wall biosynthesis
MRIGLMLRAYGEQGGIGVYTRNLVRELLGLDSNHEFVLYHQDARHLGAWADHPRVTERLVRGRSKAFWDQVTIPLACRRDRIEVLLHPKFTAPLLAPCPVVMVVHGADWFIPEQARYYNWLNVQYNRALLSLYFDKCTAVISVSQLTTENFERVLNLPLGKIHTIYFGPARHFRPICEAAELDRVRDRYRLPEKFILHLTKRGGGNRKNLGQVLRAYALYHQRTVAPHHLVIGGQDVQQYQEEYGLLAAGYGQAVHFPGWIDQDDLPAVYSLADLFLYPSNLEAFPIPIAEAMACGTPIVTSDRNGLSEVAGDAGVQVDPGDAGAIAAAVQRVLSDASMRAELSARGRARAQRYTWEACAKQTLGLLETVGGYA